ncbi:MULTISPECIES: glycosyltransferase [unclassified Novosphingobium]|uniref:glycosyltransferase n=1 Tax=unclassified Novosphingobium TaxID=2644732 RepID=UPI000EBE2146|nr:MULTISPECIES: glycosyltransferase [unclassified Novosphingobium]HCF24575.1 glycosyltransferase [Novosphingobium sp.]HQV03671.1 glycosyltransferase [Novosphingobium sp.]
MSAPLKVLQLASCGPLYGAERWILALVRNLDPALVESHVAVIADSPDAETPLLDLAQAAGAKVHRIRADGRLSLAAVPQLRQLLQDAPIDVIHSHGYKPDALTLLAARGTGTRTLTTAHGWSHAAGLKVAAYEMFDRALLMGFDAVAGLSEDLVAGLARVPLVKRKLHYIPNGTDLTELAEAGPLPPDLAALKQRGPVIGYVGQLIERKNLETLLRAFAQLGHADASLVLLGEGEERARLEALARDLAIADQVCFAGFRPDRLAWMSGFDAFVLPSFVEGIPRAMMEAMALGCPVVASDIPGTRQLVDHGQTGLLFPPEDPAALALGIERALGELGRAMATAGQRRVEERFSAAAMARRYERLFADLAGRKA